MKMNDLDTFHEKPPIEVNFPLNDSDILKILKGVEYNQIVAVGALDTPPIRFHIKVFSSDRIKHISLDNWRKIVRAAYASPELMHIIDEIERE